MHHLSLLLTALSLLPREEAALIPTTDIAAHSI